MLKRTETLLTELWALTRPYWFSEERRAALVLLAVVGLNRSVAGQDDFCSDTESLDQRLKGYHQGQTSCR